MTVSERVEYYFKDNLPQSKKQTINVNSNPDSPVLNLISSTVYPSNVVKSDSDDCVRSIII